MQPPADAARWQNRDSAATITAVRDLAPQQTRSSRYASATSASTRRAKCLTASLANPRAALPQASPNEVRLPNRSPAHVAGAPSRKRRRSRTLSMPNSGRRFGLGLRTTRRREADQQRTTELLNRPSDAAEDDEDELDHKPVPPAPQPSAPEPPAPELPPAPEPSQPRASAGTTPHLRQHRSRSFQRRRLHNQRRAARHQGSSTRSARSSPN